MIKPMLNLLLLVALSILSIDERELVGQEFANSSLLGNLTRLEELHRRVYTAVDWKTLNDASVSYEMLAIEMKASSDRLSTLGTKLCDSRNDNTRIQFVRSMRILGIPPSQDLAEFIKLGTKTENPLFLEEALSYLLVFKTSILEGELLNLLNRQEPELIVLAIKLYVIGNRSDKVEERIVALLQSPIEVVETLGGQASFETDARCTVLEILLESDIASKSIREQCEKLISSDDSKVEAAALAYLCKTASETDSNDCAAFRDSLLDGARRDRVALLRAGLLGGVLSSAQQNSVMATMSDNENSRRQLISQLRLVQIYNDGAFQNVIQKLIQSASSDELYLLARELEYVHVSDKIIATFADKLVAINDVNAMLASRAAIISLARASYGINPNSALEFKQRIERDSVSPEVRKLFSSIDRTSFFRVRHSLCDSFTIKK